MTARPRPRRAVGLEDGDARLEPLGARSPAPGSGRRHRDRARRPRAPTSASCWVSWKAERRSPPRRSPAALTSASRSPCSPSQSRSMRSRLRCVSGMTRASSASETMRARRDQSRAGSSRTMVPSAPMPAAQAQGARTHEATRCRRAPWRRGQTSTSELDDRSRTTLAVEGPHAREGARGAARAADDHRARRRHRRARRHTCHLAPTPSSSSASPMTLSAARRLACAPVLEYSVYPVQCSRDGGVGAPAQDAPPGHERTYRLVGGRCRDTAVHRAHRRSATMHSSRRSSTVRTEIAQLTTIDVLGFDLGSRPHHVEHRGAHRRTRHFSPAAHCARPREWRPAASSPRGQHRRLSSRCARRDRGTRRRSVQRGSGTDSAPRGRGSHGGRMNMRHLLAAAALSIPSSLRGAGRI